MVHFGRLVASALCVPGLSTAALVHADAADLSGAAPVQFMLRGEDGVQAPWLLRIPEDYVPALAAMHKTEGTEFSLLALYPSFGAFVAGAQRCGQVMCGDEVGATVRLRSEPPAQRDVRATRATMQANQQEVERGTVFEDMPVPPGYEQAFRVTKAALPGRAYTASRVEYLVYADVSGQARLIACNAQGTGGSCRTESFDPASGIALTLTLPRGALDKRDEVDQKTRALVGSWRVPGP